MFRTVLNVTLCSSSMPGNGDRNDAELLGHLLCWRSCWSSSWRPSLAAALCVQGPRGYQVPSEACRESRLQRNLCDCGHTVPRKAYWWCAQQVPASSPPQVGAPNWGVGWACCNAACFPNDTHWAYVLCCGLGAEVCYLNIFIQCKTVCQAAWGCRLAKLKMRHFFVCLVTNLWAPSKLKWAQSSGICSAFEAESSCRVDHVLSRKLD